jgi:hypothetical protein
MRIAEVEWGTLHPTRLFENNHQTLNTLCISRHIQLNKFRSCASQRR